MITVLTGVNGARNSSLLGSSLKSIGKNYFNPNEAARKLTHEDTNLTLQ